MLYTRKSALVIAAILGVFGVSVARTAGGPEAIGDTLYSFLAPCYWPMGLAWDGVDFWLSDNEEDSLYRLGLDGTVKAAFALPDSMNSPAGMTFIGPNLWAVDENKARLYVLDTSTAQPLKVFRLPDSLHSDATSWGLAWDGTHLWHSQYAWGMIFELDTTDGSVVSSFAPPDSWIMGLEYDGEHLWGVSTQTERAFVMDLPSGNPVANYSWQVPYSLGMALVDGYMWCASGKSPSGTRRVYKVDIGQAALAESPEPGRVLRLARAAPNPFRARTSIRTGRGTPAIADTRVFDTQGRLVRRLSTDRGAVMWDGTDEARKRAAPGAYVISVRFADGTGEQQPVRLSR
jgi:hypothetical protein